ncbi:MAG: hypothetical protein V4669_13845 [Pseudomonadota bacterium]
MTSTAFSLVETAELSVAGALITRLAPRDVALDELEQHIKDCGWHLECAYARYEAFGSPADRDAACQWLHLQNEAIHERDLRVGGRRHAEFEQRLREGVDYFNSRHAVALARGLA